MTSNDQRPRCNCCGEFLGPEHVRSQQRIQDLLDSISEGQEYQEWSEEREARLIRERDRANREEADEQRQRDADRWDQESRRRAALTQLEDARRYGNDYAEAEAIRKLRGLG